MYFVTIATTVSVSSDALGRPVPPLTYGGTASSGPGQFIWGPLTPGTVAEAENKQIPRDAQTGELLNLNGPNTIGMA